MAQTALDFNFTLRPTPEQLNLKPGSHSDRIYRRLLEGELTNSEIVRGIGCYNSTGRISGIRKKLRPYLLDIEARRVSEGLFSYRLRG